MAISTAPEFLKALEKSRLLTPEQLTAARQQSGQAGANPRPLIEALLERRQLTRWQVNQLLAGQSNFFLGKYKLLDRIGAGGMGTVFKAEHVNMGRVVALKLISSELMNQPDSVARFRREVHMAASLHHPHIVTAYDADQVGRHHFLVMEFVEGSSLFDWIKQHGRLPIDWACECIRQASIGLDYAHRKGVVHRDIKPNNLLVMAQDTTGVPILKILDMGLARSASEEHVAEELTNADQVLGTPDYMSPEQAEDSRTADLRSDIFSLGCTLFKLLTGQVPFAGKNAMEKLTARIRNDAPRATTLRPEIPPGLDAIIARMLARNPADRFQTCQEVAKALEPYASGTAGASEESSSIILCNEVRGWSPSQAHKDSSLQDFLGALSNAPDQNTPAQGHSRTLSGPLTGPIVTSSRPSKARRKAADQQKLIFYGTSAAVACLLALGLVWMFLPRPAVLLVQWPPEDRRSATLAINGQEQSLSANGPVSFELQPGTYRLFIARRGFEPINEEKTVARGDQWVVVPQWKKIELAVPTFETKLEKRQAADLNRAKVDWIAAQTKRQQELTAGQAQRTQELKKLETEIQQAASETSVQSAALRAKALDFRRRWLGSTEAALAGALLSQLPAPADALDRGKIPAHELETAGSGDPSQAPAELAWVFGDSRLKHASIAYSVAFSPDGKLAAVGTETGQIELWDPQTGLAVRQLKGAHSGLVRCLAFSPDSRWLFSGGDDGGIQLWQTATGQQGFRLSGHKGRVRSIAFSRSGKMLASGGQDHIVRIWDALLGDELHALAGHTAEVVSVAFHPQQEVLASGSVDKTARLWNATTGDELHSLATHTADVNAVAFVAEGQRLVTASNDGLIKLWDSQSRSELFTLNWDGGGIGFLAVSPRGDRLAAGNATRVWIRSAADGAVQQKLEMPSIGAVAFNSSGSELGVCVHSSLKLFDVTTGQARLPLPTHASVPRGMVFSPDGGTLYSTGNDQTLQAWNAATGERRYQQKVPAGEALAISPNGELLALASTADAVIRVRDAATGLERMALAGHKSANYAAAFSPDGKQLATGGQDQILRVWDLTVRSEIAQLTGPTSPVTALAYGIDGMLYAGYQNGQVYLWDVAKLQPALTLSAHTAGVTCLALHTSGQFLATGGSDQTVQIWDLRKAEAMQKLSLPGATPHDVVFSLDGKTLLATTSLGTIRFLEFPSGRQLRQLQMSDLQPFRLLLSPDGRYVATGLRNGSIHLLRIAER